MFRRRGRTAAATAAALLALAGCGSSGTVNLAAGPSPLPVPPSAAPVTPSPSPTASATAQALAPGEKPPQFIVVSFDGAGDLNHWKFYRHVQDQTGAHMTFFLSGIYLIPKDKASLYHPPKHPVGSSDIGFADNSADVLARVEQLRAAYLSGDEIGTHYNGHFCGGSGVMAWNRNDWASELDQFNSFLTDWRTNNDAVDESPLPFGPKDIVGERTPCLDGKRSVLYPLLADRGFRYDSSGDGDLSWPRKLDSGLWDIPMQELRMAHTGQQVLSMDYNFYELQSGGHEAGAFEEDRMQRDVEQTYQNAYHALYNGNGAPLIIGAHFANWNDDIYHHALADFMKSACDQPQTRCVSFQELVDWLDAQAPATRAALAALPVQNMPY